ncbi:MAG TPA: ice-binding family protein [Candidatus Limnocylindria bacterium]|nr:ice-binding family protein [Candidatus Limnocylindria bacterium]
MTAAKNECVASREGVPRQETTMRTSKPRSHCKHSSLLVCVGLSAVLLCGASPAFAQAIAPSLGAAESFAVLGGETVTNTGPSVITGDLGVSPGSAITGFPPGIVVGGTIHAADAVALQAKTDVTAAYLNLAGQACDFDLTDQDLGGLTLTPGVYCFASSAQLTGDLILDAEGDPDAVFIFQMGSTLTTASNSSVLVINGAQECNVFWQVGSSATLGTGTTFIGNVLALTSITLTTGASVSGRALARNGAVTLDTNDVAAAVCEALVAPRLHKRFRPATINGGKVSRLRIHLINPNPSPADLTAALTDTLPNGVVIAATPNAVTTCAGTGAVIATAGGTTLTLPDTRSIPAGSGGWAGKCTVTVNVTAAAAGSYLNTLAADALQTSLGNNAAPASAALTVATRAPRLRKSFNPATINAGAVSRLTITLINPNFGPAELTARLRDTLPDGVVIAATPNAVTTCPGTGAVIAKPGRTALTLPDTGSIPAGSGGRAGKCTVKVNVTAAAAGSYLNTLAVNALRTSNGNNASAASATLTVTTRAPKLRKAFNPAHIKDGGVSRLTITLINPNPTPADLTKGLTDTLPDGMVIAARPNAITTCAGNGAVIATAGGTTVMLPDTRSIPASSGRRAGKCTVKVNVTAAAAGSYLNTLAVDALQTSHGDNAEPASATLTVKVHD